MKTPTKLLALLLVISMLSAMLLACDKGSDDTETKAKDELQTTAATEGSETETEFFPDVEKKDYDTELYMESYPGDLMLKYMYAEEGLGDVVTEALYDRQQKLLDYLGVEMIGKAANGDNNTYTDAYTTSVKNKDGAIDLFIAQAYVGVVKLVEGGYIRDLKTVDGLNLDADYWNSEYMDSIALYDRYYLGYGSFCIANTFTVTYNKVMLEQYADSLTESLYDSVRNYRWTIDKMISLASLVYADTTGDGKTEDDTYGMSGNQWIPFIGFLHGSNIQLVEQDDKGDYRVAVLNDKYRERTVSLAAKLKEFASSNAAWFKYRIEDTPIIDLKTNRALMVLQGAKSMDSLLSTGIEFGVLPYPMYDEDQKDVGYRHLNYDGYITIPSYSRDLEMVSASVELLNFWGKEVTVAVYEKLLGKQVADTPDDAAMLEIIWDSLVSDFGLTYSTISDSLDGILYMLPTVTNPNGTEEIASFVAQHEKTGNKAIDKFMKIMGKK